MENPTKILFSDKVELALTALDVSAIDESVLRYLKFLSGKVKMDSIYFCHVAPGATSFDPFFMFDTVSDLDNVWKLDQEIFDALNTQVSDVFGEESDMKFQFEVVAGNPLDEILASASNMEADLVVMGRKNNEEGNQGVLAKNVARRVKAAALFVPEISEPTLSKIVVPFDFSDNAKRALHTAINLNKQLGGTAEITVLSIYDMPAGLGLDVGKSPDEVKKSFLVRMKEAFTEILKDFGVEEASNIALKTIETNNPAVARIILNYAKENKQDMIVMGAAGHSQVEYLLIGSITEKLLTLNDEIPVLVVK